MKRPHAICLTLLTLLGASALLVYAQEGDSKRRKVTKTDAEWARLLTRQQFFVTRRKETEPAFSGKYVYNHAKGVFACVCCGAELFSSRAKFESGTGWPSFWQPIGPKQVDSAPDYLMDEPRIEVMCNACGAHLGHVFDDGPPPTGLRFCINSASLKFLPAAGSSKTSKSTKTGKSAKKKDAPPAEKKDSEKSEEKEGKTEKDEK